MSSTTLITYFVAALFAFMGVGSIVLPSKTLAQFGISDLNADGRNEVRAVYGGFGLATALLLIAATQVPEIRFGVMLSIGVALSGMAFGRIISALIDREIGRIPLFYLVLELIAAVLLFWSSVDA